MIMNGLEALAPYSPRQLAVSSRGSGLNAVWEIRLAGRPVILKTYSSRRGVLSTFLSNTGHVFGGRTSYLSEARYQTELSNLDLWRNSGFEVPGVVQHDFNPPLPVKYLCMEYVDGPLLSSYLSDPDISAEKKDSVLAAFLRRWAERHTAAENLREPRLVQEHATFNHVILAGDRFVTFDLEVSYTGSANIQRLIAYEICGYLRSIFKRLPEDRITRFLDILVENYPRRDFLSAVYRELFESRDLSARFIHLIDRILIKRGRKMHKYQIACELKNRLMNLFQGRY